MSLEMFIEAADAFLFESKDYVDADKILAKARDAHDAFKAVLREVVNAKRKVVFVKDDKGLLANVSSAQLKRDINKAIDDRLDGANDDFAAYDEMGGVDTHQEYGFLHRDLKWFSAVKFVSAKQVKSPRTGSRGFKITFSV